MGDAWGGWKNGQIPAQPMQKVQGYYLRPDAAEAMRGAIAELAKSNITIYINESYRPLGVPADANVRNQYKTSTKCSNQWFQYGRMKRGETPAAAYPGTSVHGWAVASDITNGANATIRSVLAKYGWVFDVPSESWHAHFVGIPKPIPEPNALQKANWRLMQGYLRQWGYSGAIDGIAGVGTWTAAQKWLKARHGYVGAIDGIPGPMTYAAMKRAGSNLR
jgi:hypothetical protein